MITDSETKQIASTSVTPELVLGSSDSDANSNARHTSMTHRQTDILISSPSAKRISQALKAQRCPTNKEISPFCKFSVNMINRDVKYSLLVKLMSARSMFLCIQLNTFLGMLWSITNRLGFAMNLQAEGRSHRWQQVKDMKSHSISTAIAHYRQF